MEQSLIKEINLFGELLETKRIFSALENALEKYSDPCFIVTSAQIQEGKTFLACGLAKIAAQQKNKRVLLIDFDWYRPALHHFFDLKQPENGDIFKETKNINGLIQPSGIDNLDILTAPILDINNSSFSDEFVDKATIIKKLRETYNMTIIDSSPMFPPNRWKIDPSTIAQISDGALLVGKAKTSQLSALKRAKIILEQSKANILGLVINQFESS